MGVSSQPMVFKSFWMDEDADTSVALWCVELYGSASPFASVTCKSTEQRWGTVAAETEGREERRDEAQSNSTSMQIN